MSVLLQALKKKNGKKTVCKCFIKKNKLKWYKAHFLFYFDISRIYKLSGNTCTAMQKSIWIHIHKQTEAHVLQPICAAVRFRSDTELHLTNAIGFQLSKQAAPGSQSEKS